MPDEKPPEKPGKRPDETPDESAGRIPDAHPGPAGDADSESGGRDRLFRSLVRPNRNQVVVGLLLALLGFAVVTQVRDNQVDGSYEGLREQDLIDVFNGLAGARQRAESELAELRATRDELLSTSSRRQAAIEQAEQEADSLRILAGVVPVTGSGVRVTITEEEGGDVSVGSMLDMIQELRVADAEAMQINGEVRIVAETSFEDAGEGFLVDGHRVSPPYVLDVIGEPDLLEQAALFIGGARNAIDADGGSVAVEKLSSLDIESVHRPREPDIAEAEPNQ